ncbi:pentapeptide repeat-containing protein [Corynebacterium glutamicum]|uniref:pentapeptide repeat-containing protein n=1 Tax=Corynebacterium glutamicum TaxID=1718 RepID=UPI001B8B3030|nr:pentapeptide repeat-containing protein [Corynebacterium glutamicum]
MTGLALGPLGFPDWVKGWTLSDLDMSVAAGPLATILSASGVIVAAGIAFRNGEKNRNQEKKHQEEAAKRETERSLRDRFFKITETLSEGSEYVKREAGVYALIALADDWAAFHRDDPDAAQREQQTCLNVITGQLRDPLSADSSQAHSDSETAESAQQKKEQPQDDLGLLIFKHRVQEILWERFRPSDGAETGPWSHLDLELSNCHLHDSYSGLVQFHGSTSFYGVQFHGSTSFYGVQFHGSTSFYGAQFHGSTSFSEAQFHDSTSFSEVQFHNHASFDRAEFHATADFIGGTFFSGVQFHGSTSFYGAQFHGSTFFSGAQFHNHASFDRAEFHATADFHKTRLHGDTSFGMAEFRGSAFFDGAVAKLGGEP